MSSQTVKNTKEIQCQTHIEVEDQEIQAQYFNMVDEWIDTDPVFVGDYDIDWVDRKEAEEQIRGSPKMASKKIKKKGPAGAGKKAAGGLADAIGQIKRLDPKKTSPGNAYAEQGVAWNPEDLLLCVSS